MVGVIIVVVSCAVVALLVTLLERADIARHRLDGLTDPRALSAMRDRVTARRRPPQGTTPRTEGE